MKVLVDGIGAIDVGPTAELQPAYGSEFFISHTLRWNSALMAVHNVVETLYLGDDPTPHGPMLATNVFVRGANGWRLLSHHASAASDTPMAENGNGVTHTLH